MEVLDQANEQLTVARDALEGIGQPFVDVEPGATVAVKLTAFRRNVTNSYRFPRGPYSYTFEASRLVAAK